MKVDLYAMGDGAQTSLEDRATSDECRHADANAMRWTVDNLSGTVVSQG